MRDNLNSLRISSFSTKMAFSWIGLDLDMDMDLNIHIQIQALHHHHKPQHKPTTHIQAHFCNNNKHSSPLSQQATLLQAHFQDNNTIKWTWQHHFKSSSSTTAHQIQEHNTNLMRNTTKQGAHNTSLSPISIRPRWYNTNVTLGWCVLRAYWSILNTFFKPSWWK